ncbi:MAG: hypothetical protein M1840_002751 [Geoglossum simile]|nr:MAG: hypothetical protein M1840_002751 [Geoglossum simile]
MPPTDVPDENKGPRVLGACTTVTLAALILVMIRVYVRTRMVKNLGYDDFAIFASMVLALVSLGIIWAEVYYGCGRHVIYLKPAAIMTGLKLNFLSQPFLQWALGFVKISLCLSLLRFTVSEAWRRFFVALIIFIAAYSILGFFVIVLQCIPTRVLWTPGVKAKCMAPKTQWALIYFVVGVNIVTDLILAAAPAPILWGLQIRRRTKVALIAIMGLGVFACAAAVAKTAYLPNYGKKGDFLWDSVEITIWTVTECNVGIIAACVPSIKPLFKATLNLYSSGSHSGPNGGSNGRLSSYVRGESGQLNSSRRGLSVKTVPEKGDGESEEVILELQATPRETSSRSGDANGKSNGFEKTTKVRG